MRLKTGQNREEAKKNIHTERLRQKHVSQKRKREEENESLPKKRQNFPTLTAEPFQGSWSDIDPRAVMESLQENKGRREWWEREFVRQNSSTRHDGDNRELCFMTEEYTLTPSLRLSRGNKNETWRRDVLPRRSIKPRSVVRKDTLICFNGAK